MPGRDGDPAYEDGGDGSDDEDDVSLDGDEYVRSDYKESDDKSLDESDESDSVAVVKRRRRPRCAAPPAKRRRTESETESRRGAKARRDKVKTSIENKLMNQNDAVEKTRDAVEEAWGKFNNEAECNAADLFDETLDTIQCPEKAACVTVLVTNTPVLWLSDVGGRRPRPRREHRRRPRRSLSAKRSRRRRDSCSSSTRRRSPRWATYCEGSTYLYTQDSYR